MAPFSNENVTLSISLIPVNCTALNLTVEYRPRATISTSGMNQKTSSNSQTMAMNESKSSAIGNRTEVRI